jgi:tetratricopeptide (TPR) repeat protein
VVRYRPVADERRAVRVFISSTFRDMQAEREELVKRVFPELRRRCEERGVAWAEVDLRWGVTDEQKAEGAVLPICLAEIERSRPWFLGLLGERYGWVPDEVPADLATRLGWLEEDRGRSVTELEILHGVLNDPSMAGHAFFYLRDPAWVDRLAAEERAAAVDDDPEARARLAALKDRIRGSGFPVRDGYPDPEALGRMVRDDLLAVLDRLFPADDVPDPLDRERREQAAWAERRTAVFLPRPGAAEALDGGGAVVVTGEPGSGKSAVLAAWAAGRPGVVVHHVQATAASADWAAMLRRLIAVLDPAAGEPPGDPDALKLAFAAALHRAGTAAPGRVVAVDGVDHLEDRDGAPDLAWLPPTVPAGVRVVLSAGPGRSLDAAVERGFTPWRVPPLSADERRRLVAANLARWAKALAPDLTDRLASSPLTGNPLALVTVVDELRQHGDHFTLGAVVDHYLAAGTVDDLFERVLARWERDFERERPGLVGDALTLLWAARRGLAEPELLELLAGPNAGGPLPHAAWSPLFLAAEAHLATRSGLLSPASDHLRRAIEDRYRPAAAHATLASYFLARPPTPRTVDEGLWQLVRAEWWDDLAAALADPAVLDAAYRRDLADVRATWAVLEARSAHRMPTTYAAVLADPAADPGAAWQVARLLTDAGHAADAAALHRSLVDLARRDGDDRALAAALGNLAAALLTVDDLDGADAALAEQEAACRRAGDQDGLALCLANRAVALRARRDLDGAIALFAAEERRCRERGDARGLQAALGNLGATLRDRGDGDGALARFAEQELVCRRIGDPLLLRQALAAKGAVLADRGDLAGALAVQQDHERVCRELGDLDGLHVSLGNQAVTLLQLGDLDGALRLLGEEEAICARTGRRTGLARSLLAQAMVRQQQGDLDATLALLDRHEPVARSLAQPSALAANLGIRATVARARGDAAAALSLHVDEEHLYRQAGDLPGVAASLGNQALARMASGDGDAAGALFDEQERICRQVGDANGLQTALGNHAALLLQRGDLDGAARLLDEQERICRDAGHLTGLATCVGNQGIVALHRGDLDGAVRRYAEQERLCRQSGDANGLQTSLGNQAAVAVQRGDGATAARLLGEQVAICRSLGLWPDLRKSAGLLVQVLTAAADAAGLITAWEHVEEASRRLGDPATAATALTNRATLVGNTGRPADAVALLAAAEEAFAAAGDANGRQMAMGNRGLALYQLGRLDEADAVLAAAEDLCRRANLLDGLQSAVGNRALVAQARGDATGAVALLEEQERLARQAGNAGAVVIAMANRGEVLGGVAGRERDGLALLDQAAALADQYGAGPMAAQIRQLAAAVRARLR